MDRRKFLTTLSGLIVGLINKSCSSNNSKDIIQLGCFNRPYNDFSFEQTLDGIKNAGYNGIGLFGNPKHLIINPETADEDGGKLNDLLTERNLKIFSYTPRFNIENSPKEMTEGHIPVMQILQKIGCSRILVMGTNKEELYPKYYELMKYYSDTAQQYNIQIVLKPHGGISSSGALCVEAVKKVGSDNFRICYDPTNIFYYDSYDPVEELKVCAEYVTAMCVKDFRREGAEKPNIYITPGDGEVNFEEIFAILKSVNFKGPCIIECLAGKTIEEVNNEAKRACNYISKLI